jgi:hypothetical protein
MKNTASLKSCWIALATMLAFGTSANAQTSIAQKAEARIAAAVKTIESACGSDVKTYCSTVTPGEGRLVYCMLAHEDKISTKCEYALYKAQRDAGRALDRVEQAAEACWQDIEKLCANVPEGGGRIAQCLVDNKTKLRKACAATLAKLPATK